MKDKYVDAIQDYTRLTLLLPDNNNNIYLMPVYIMSSLPPSQYSHKIIMIIIIITIITITTNTNTNTNRDMDVYIATRLQRLCEGSPSPTSSGTTTILLSHEVS